MQMKTDFLGCVQRIQNIQTQWNQRIDELQSHWHDAQAEHFSREHLHEVNEVLRRWILALHQANELAAKIATSIADDPHGT